ncbi:Putative Nuclear protein export factor [Aspergillus calidoustus]|uniref:Putative Nuclear protein export factor n=1 Tax=Aspergillus calidoustus TaxID=454130 RepID=A0A0U4Z527_ASPCI|nr:Putative Nuclear protein export factor [Aspergillus calidoustus]
MASPANPFAVLHQTDGAASSRGRGRGGAFNRPTTFQPRGGSTNVPFNPSLRGRGRGRGASTATRAGRGNARGAGAAGNTWRGGQKPEGQTRAASPFAQLKQTSPATTSPAPATGPLSQQKPAFTGFGRGSPRPFGAASSTRRGTTVNSARDPRTKTHSNPTNGGPRNGVPVEDVSTVESYSDRYEQLKLDRAKQRQQAIKDGQMADPNQPMSLNKAITPVGTCTSMCPQFERVERIVQKMVDKSEKYLDPKTNTLQNLETKMLKRFRRSAAGYDEQLPSDIRTPATLLQTMNYLTRHIIGGSEPLGLIHKFVWDRTRSIRNDFSVQQLTQEEDVKVAVTCLERIARFHIVSLHLLSSPENEEPFDRHQEREQLNNTMLSLMYYYDDNRGRIFFPNEDEFRAYYIIFSIHDQRPDLEARVQKWPTELRNSPRVKTALELFAAAGNTWEYQGTLDAKRPNAIAQGFYERFFSLVNSPGVSYLMACVAEIYFNHMRQTAIRSIWKGYCRYPASQQHKNEEWTVDELTSVLYFDDADQTIEFCEAQDLEFAENANGDLYLNWGSRPVDSVAFQPSSDHSFSDSYVESKRAGRNLVAIVLGLNVKEAATLGMIDRELLSERNSAMTSHDNDESLFVSDDDNEMSTPTSQSNNTTSMTGALSSAFGASSQPAPGNLPSPGLGASFSPKPEEPKPSVSPNPFGPLFPSASSQSSSVSPPAPSLNPFAKPFSPLPSARTTEKPTPSPPPVSNGQPASVFSSGAMLAQSKAEQKAPSPAISPFQFPGVSQPSKPASPFPSGNALAQAKPEDKASTPPAATPFQFPGVSKLTSQSSAPDIFSNIQQPTPSTTSPFSAPQLPATVQPSGPTAGQSSTSVFDTAKPTPASEGRAPVFSFSKPEPVASKPQASASEISISQPPPQPTQAFPSFQPEKKKEEAPSILLSPKPSPFPAPSTFGLPIASTPQPSSNQLAAGPSASPAQESASSLTASQEPSPLASNGIVKKPAFPPPLQSKMPETAAPQESAPGVQADVPETDHAPVKTVSEEQEPAQGEAERKLAWINSLKEAASRRRRTVSTPEATPTSRKRVFEEQETPPAKDEVKAQKVAKPERPRKSMAQASVRPLPKLPILEAIESMTARKPVEKPGPPKPNQVDEDEILLSAARIAAETLRTGPRLLDAFSAPTTYEPWRSSFSPGSSVASSVAFSRSQSPQQSVHGYDVALAPETNLGLGRTLSRTEQRLRLTGGKGLAYKPLNFSPGSSLRTPPKK